jgi:hypothetical protein
MWQNLIRTTGFFEKRRWNSSPLLEMIPSVVDHYTPGCLTRIPQNRSLTPTQPVRGAPGARKRSSLIGSEGVEGADPARLVIGVEDIVHPGPEFYVFPERDARVKKHILDKGYPVGLYLTFMHWQFPLNAGYVFGRTGRIVVLIGPELGKLSPGAI